MFTELRSPKLKIGETMPMSYKNALTANEYDNLSTWMQFVEPVVDLCVFLFFASEIVHLNFAIFGAFYTFYTCTPFKEKKKKARRE